MRLILALTMVVGLTTAASARTVIQKLPDVHHGLPAPSLTAPYLAIPPYRTLSMQSDFAIWGSDGSMSSDWYAIEALTQLSGS